VFMRLVLEASFCGQAATPEPLEFNLPPRHNKIARQKLAIFIMAEREGFEPSVPLLIHSLSRTAN
jgi:hypothetical protein